MAGEWRETIEDVVDEVGDAALALEGGLGQYENRYQAPPARAHPRCNGFYNIRGNQCLRPVEVPLTNPETSTETDDQSQEEHSSHRYSDESPALQSHDAWLFRLEFGGLSCEQAVDVGLRAVAVRTGCVSTGELLGRVVIMLMALITVQDTTTWTDGMIFAAA